jgi:hypothetical protein
MSHRHMPTCVMKLKIENSLITRMKIQKKIKNR